MRKLSKSVEEYVSNDGWSSANFLAHAKFVFGELTKINAEVNVGRTVIYVKLGDKTIKAYVHHNGRSKEWVTLTDTTGVELESIHYTATPAEMFTIILKHLS